MFHSTHTRCGYAPFPPGDLRLGLAPDDAPPEHAVHPRATAHLEVCITVLSAQNPRVDDPYVRVELFDVDGDVQSTTTVTCESNQLNPYWGSISTFPISRIDTALVRFALYDDDPAVAAAGGGGNTRGFVGQHTTPLASISSGFRYIPMETFNGSRLDKCTLFVKVEFKPLSKGGLMSRIGLSKTPAQRLRTLVTQLIADSSTRRANGCPPTFIECVHALSVSMTTMDTLARSCHVADDHRPHPGDALSALAVATSVHRMVDACVGAAVVLATQLYTPQEHSDLLPSEHAHVTPHTSAAVLFVAMAGSSAGETPAGALVARCNAFQHGRIQVLSDIEALRRPIRTWMHAAGAKRDPKMMKTLRTLSQAAAAGYAEIAALDYVVQDAYVTARKRHHFQALAQGPRTAKTVTTI
eukprot:m.777069 g.777069  ORF g.777069 m.777069 type:complete len:412 (+) comp23263_c0_seq50:2194-3429(+)